MRFMVTCRVPMEAGNAAIKDGSLPQTEGQLPRQRSK